MIRLNNRGETIVEVLVILAIVSAVLGVAFASTTGNLNRSREAQERSEGNAIAQDRLERLKKIIASRSEAPTARFCVTESNTIVPIPATAGTDDIALDKFQDYPAGCVTGRYATFFTFNSAENLYTANVRWDNASGESRDNIQVRYRTSFIANASPDPNAPAAPAPVRTDSCPTPDYTRIGVFFACYYNRISFEDFALAREEVKPTGFSYDWGTGSPAPQVEDDTISARWQGNFYFAETKSYNFRIKADDGVRVWVDDVLLYDKFIQQAPTEYNIRKDLTAGNHKIRYDWYENSGLAVAQIEWGPSEMLARTGLVWIDLTTANVQPNDVNSARVASGKDYCWQVYEYFRINQGVDDGWGNNYLCSNRNLQITWSQAGPVAGKFCYQWLATGDPDTWNDNYLCADQALGVRFSESGSIPGMSCISIREPRDNESAIWGSTGTARLCENAAAPPAMVIENETFSGAGSSVSESGTSAGAKRLHYGAGDSNRTLTTPKIGGMVVRAKGDLFPANGYPNMTVKVDGNTVYSGAVTSTSYGEYRIGGVNIPAGSHSFIVSFDNDAYCGTAETDRNLHVDKIDVYEDMLMAPSTPPQRGPTAAPTCPPPPGPTASDCSPSAPSRFGTFVGCYYTDRNATNLGMVRADNSVNFDWGSGSPDPSIPADNFSVRWKGDFGFAADTYNFTVTGDDGVRLTIDGTVVLDKYFDQSPTTYTVPVTLSQGTHNVKLDFYENGGTAVARLTWNPRPPAPTPTNVALNKPVSNSYCRPGNYYYVVPDSRLTDGNLGTNTAQCNWTFDYVINLGGAYNISSIKPYWGHYGCVPGQACSNGYYYINNWQVYYSNDGTNWSYISGGGFPNAAQTVINTNINARYLRVYATSSYNWIAMYELEAMGLPL